MRAVLRLVFLMGVVSAASITWAETIKVSALVVAYGTLPSCINGNAYWSLILQVEAPNQLRGKFVQVNFSQPCGISPKVLNANSRILPYRLIRDKTRDAVLEEFINCEDTTAKDGSPEPCPRIPAWRRPSEADNKGLPFGTKIPAYRDTDLPLVPPL